MATLKKLRNDAVQKTECRLESECLVNKMDNLETGMAAIWNTILQRFNAVSKALHYPKLDLNSVISIFDSLIYFVALHRDRFTFFETIEKDLSGTTTYPEDVGERRKRKRNSQLDDDVLHVDLPPSIPPNSLVDTLTDRLRMDTPFTPAPTRRNPALLAINYYSNL